MQEVLHKPKKRRVLPASVLTARLNNDKATLSDLGRHGSSKLSNMRAAERVRQEAAAKRALTNAEKAEASERELVFQTKTLAIQEDLFNEVVHHAAITRPGWDDDYEVVSGRVDVGAATSDVVWFGTTTLWTKSAIAESKRRERKKTKKT